MSVASASYSLGPVEATWTLKDGNINGVCVAPSVVEEGKKKEASKQCSRLKSRKDSLRSTEDWINSKVGNVPVSLSLLDELSGCSSSPNKELRK